MSKLKDNSFVSDDEEPLLGDPSKESGKLFKNRSEVFTVISMAVGYLFGGLSFSILGPFFAPEAHKRGVNGTITGLIFAIHPILIFLLAPVVSKMLPYFGIKTCIIIGIGLESISQILYGIVGDMYTGTTFIVISFVCRGVTAVGVTFSEVAFLALICMTFSENLGLFFGINEIFTGLGLTLGPVLGGFLFKAGGFKLPFIVLGCGVLVSLVLIAFILPSEVKMEEPETSDVSILDVLRIPEIILMLSTLIVIISSVTFLDPTLADHLNNITQPEGMTSDKAGLVFLIHAFMYASTAPFVGWLIDRKGNYYRLIMIIGFVISIFGLLLIGPAPFLFLKPKVYLVCISLVFLGTGISLVNVPILPVMNNFAMEAGLPNDLSTTSIVSGLFASALNIGTALGPALGGFLVDKLSFAWAAIFWACLLFVQVLITLLFNFFEKRIKILKTVTQRDEDLQSSKIQNGELEMVNF